MRPASASSASSAFRRSATAASAVGPPPTAPTRAQLGIGAPERRPRPVLRRKAHGLCGSLPILRCQERGADRCAGRSRPAPNNHRPAVASRSASRKHGRPDRLGEHEMPTPFGNSKNLAELEPRHGIEPWIFSLPCMMVSSDSVALGRIIAGQSGPILCTSRMPGSGGSSISGTALPQQMPEREQAPIGGPEPGLPEQTGQHAFLRQAGPAACLRYLPGHWQMTIRQIPG